MRGILTISKITLKEGYRGKIFVGLLFFVALFFVFSVYISALSLGTVSRVIENTGMLGISVVCLIVTILFGLFSLYQEKDRNELYVILNRVSRSSYILGRFLGSAYIIIIFSFFSGLGIFALIWIFGNKFAPELFWAVYWAILEFTMLMATGFLFYALQTSFTLNSIMVIAVFIVGHSLDEAVQSFVGLGRFGNKFHLMAVKTISYIFPNFDMFDFRLAIVHSENIPAGHILLSSVYWFFYTVALLFLCSFIMKQKDI